MRLASWPLGKSAILQGGLSSPSRRCRPRRQQPQMPAQDDFNQMPWRLGLCRATGRNESVVQATRNESSHAPWLRPCLNPTTQIVQPKVLEQSISLCTHAEALNPQLKEANVWNSLTEVASSFEQTTPHPHPHASASKIKRWSI